MMLSRQLLFLIFSMAILAGIALPQEAAPLVRPKKDAVKVTVGKKPKKDDKAAAGTPAAKASDPATTIVGIVNAHRLTKMQLQFYVEQQLKGLGSRALLSDREGTMVVLDKSMKVDRSYESDPEMREMRDRQQDDSKRRLEQEALKSWVEQRMLADEARRQGIALKTKDYEARLAEVKHDLGLSDDELAAFLAKFQITAAQFESEVYDALLVEQLSLMFVDANWTDEQLKPLYEASPQDFVEPPRVRIAQFVIALAGNETPDVIKALRGKAEKVRKRFQKEKDLEKVIKEESDLNNGIYGTADSGFISMSMTSMPEALARAVEKAAPGTVTDVTSDVQDSDAGKIMRSLQVAKVIERREAPPPTFESGKALLRARLAQKGRAELVARLYDSKSHLVITNLSAIPADALPTEDQMKRMQAEARPLPLRRTAAPPTKGS